MFDLYYSGSNPTNSKTTTMTRKYNERRKQTKNCIQRGREGRGRGVTY